MPVDRFIPRDSEQPGGEAGLIAVKPGKGTPGVEKDLLDDVFGVLGSPKASPKEPEEVVEMLKIELAEQRGIAPGPFDQGRPMFTNGAPNRPVLVRIVASHRIRHAHLSSENSFGNPIR